MLAEANMNSYIEKCHHHLYAENMRFPKEKNPTEDGKKNQKLKKTTSYDKGYLAKTSSRVINISESRSNGTILDYNLNVFKTI